MAKTDPEATSKERILQAAEDLFARKGFDGARVDEIARLAGVNKALIYYYFESKEGILQALISDLIEGLVTFLGNYDEILLEMLASEDLLRKYVPLYLEQIERRKNMLSIIMMELLKESGVKVRILEYLDRYIREELGRYQEVGFTGDTEQLVLTEFFTGAIPLVMFVLLKESWMKVYRMSEEKLRDRFLAGFLETHGRYTFDLMRKNLAAQKAEKKENTD